ncbi:hypothetical protein [Desulfobulbus elongatus]|uniref:hypothetical protein n=1 Tax=Desulfobulbus elongatus TaxID=53332 RepID=UPI0004848011|nr:hypothetical protein [Desulfobulbus elongatus]
MTTESIRIVDPGNGAGTDYTSLNLWAVAEAADLVSADIIAVAQCRATGGAADTTMVQSLSGWLSDSNRYVKIWTDPTEEYRHSGRWDDAAYRLSASTNQAQTVLRALDDIGTANLHVHIRGIQVRNARIASYAHALGIGRGTNGSLTTGTIDQCVVQTLCPGAQTRALNLSRGTTVATNCLVLATDGAGACVGEYNGTSICRNITTWGGAYGFLGEPNWINEVTNCIAMGAATACFSGVSAGHHNISSDATALGTTVVHNQTDYATYFTNHASGDYHLTAPSEVLFGIAASDLSSTFTDDIDGDTRASASFGHGADYYVASGPVSAELTASWRIFAEQGLPAAWKLYTRDDEHSAWRVVAASPAGAAWKIKVSLANPSAWKLLRADQANAAWKIKSLVDRSSAWAIATALDRSAAWQILTAGALDLTAEWSIRAQLDRSTVWRIRSQFDRTTAWKLYTSTDIQSGWKIIHGFSHDTAWRIASVLGSDASWAVYAAIEQTASWRIISGPASEKIDRIVISTITGRAIITTTTGTIIIT